MRLSYKTELTHRGMLRTVMLTPLNRLQDAPFGGRALGVIAGVLQAFWGWPLGKVLLLLTIASALDFMLGKEAARQRGEFDADIARAGIAGKASGVVLVMLLAGVEVVFTDLLSTYGAHLGVRLLWTPGVLATVFGFTLIIAELESYDKHRQQLVGRPTPLLRPFLDLLRSVVERPVPTVKKKGH